MDIRQIVESTLVLPAYKQSLDAACDRIAKIEAVLRDLLADIDEETSNNDGEHAITPYTGCLECTLGTVPNDKNTGLCAYHRAQALLK